MLAALFAAPLLAAAETTLPTALDSLLLQVTGRHPSVLSALAEARAADLDLEVAHQQRYPTLSVQNETNGGRPGTSLQINQPVWTAGRLSAQIEAARAGASAAGARTGELRYTMAGRTLDAWQTLVAAEGRIRAIDASLAVLTGYEALMRRRVDAQVSPRIELDLIASRTLQSRADLQTAHSQKRLALARLAQLAGAELPIGLADSGDELHRRADALAAGLGRDPSAAFASAIDLHPAVLRTQHEASAAAGRLDVARAERWPQVYLKLQRDYGDRALPNPSGNSVFVGMQYTPGAGLSSATRTLAAETRADASAQTREAARRDVADQLRSDWEALSAALDRERLLLPTITGGRAVLDSYERQFVAGKRTWQDVLNALRELTQSETALAETRAALMAASYRLAVQLGRIDWLRHAALAPR